MADLFSASEKLILSNNFNDIHDTFSRPIYIYRRANEVLISENPENNFIWDNAPNNSQAEIAIVSGMFNARIKYGTEQKRENFSSETRNNAEEQNVSTLEMGMVRIKLDPSGAAFIGDAERVKFDDEVFEITTSKRPHGLFTPQFYTYFLKKLN